MNKPYDDYEQFESGLRRVLWELREYLNDIVVIGGWVPHLYRKYGGFDSWRSSLSRTGEVDILLTSALDTLGRRPLATILADAGFKPEGDRDRAAVWLGNAEQGEQIELFVPHVGVAGQIGSQRPIEMQERLAAISLPDLELLSSFTSELRIRVTVARQPATDLGIRIPLLGAYLTNKASTFPKRSTGGTQVPGSSKRSKDLLYIRDLAAAGAEVTQRMGRDCLEMRSSSELVAGRIDRAASNIRLLLMGSFSAALHEAADMLAERDGLGTSEALAELKGYLADAREVLRSSPSA